MEFPGHLEERIVRRGGEPDRQEGDYVLYWAHHALRAHENPALEVAACAARQLDIPLLVYQGLGGRHRYNSDRHHRFILESARSFDGELRALGLQLTFHLPDEPSCKGPLGDLVARSALAVSELYPVPPFTHWPRRHQAAHPHIPWLDVDASCSLPMTLVTDRPTRAFQFRKRHMPELRDRIARDWPAPAAWPAAFTGDPGFEPFDLDRSLGDAIAGCAIDHSVPPVADTPGGSSAGYERWNGFLQNGLAEYHRLRNDAALPGAVSRMSAYLHYGCVSPFRIAREAAAHGGEGAEKFLDELLTWRELNHHFCHHTTELESSAALPDWARRSLAQHEIDPRKQLYDWESLLRARTGEPLWNLAQRSLLRRGELHNNLRMTWGKALLPWTPRSERALKLLIDLNHRLALDGSDPNSYGGLLWCLGQFDRPFPPGPIFGSVRQRSARRHASRLDVDRYARWVSRPAGGERVRAVVVGAGLAGLNAARILQDQGHDVTVLEKARGAGGRMSTRRQGQLRFDHGAQYFTARDPRFLRHVYAWRERGLVEDWPARIAVIENEAIRTTDAHEARYVAVPGMNAICSEMAGELDDCRFGWNVARVRRHGHSWRIENTEGEQLQADVLVMALPPEQAAGLLQLDEITAELAAVRMQPCWALMLHADRPLLTEADAAFVNQGPVSWLASQAAKPGRPGEQAWVVHGSPGWSSENLEQPVEAISEELTQAVRELPGAADFALIGAVPHRWRYALAAEPLDRGAFWFSELQLAVAGDWCHGSRVEGAFLSGAAAAGRIMGACPRRT
jgi:photolyase PhrII